MSKALQLVLSRIDLTSYGNSNGFVGFFERAGPYRKGMAEGAAALFLNCYQEFLPEMTIVLSLAFNIDDITRYYRKRKDRRALAIVDNLVMLGLVRRISFQEAFGLGQIQFYEGMDEKYLNEYDEGLYRLENSFSTFPASNYSLKNLEHLLIAPMLVDGLYGHCFIVSERLGLAFYPHDDTGFGIIALNDTSDLNAARVLLIKAGNIHGCHSVIKE